MLVAYDTETTGLIKYGLPVEHPLQPKIASISAILVEETGPTGFVIRDSFDVIVKPDGWEIPAQVITPLGLSVEEAKAQGLKPSASDIHGITHERAEAEGIPLFEAMKMFNDFVVQSDGLLAHNESYDNFVIRHALKLLGRKIPMPERRVCTMMMAKDYCRLPPNFPGGDWKYPKLAEAYQIVFNRPLQNAHNSADDIAQAVELYQELRRRGVPDAVPAQERKGMKLRDWVELGWTRDRLERVISLRNQRDPRLSEWDMKFLTSLNDRLNEFGDNVYLSEKQVDIFRKLEERLFGES